jgi:hypothetical protein
MKNSKIILIGIFLFGCLSQGYSQNKGLIAKKLYEKSQENKFKLYSGLLNINTTFDMNRINNEVSDAIIFDLNKAMASEIIKESLDLISVEVKLNNSEIIRLDLYKEVDAFSSLSINASDGKEFDFDSLKASFYRGIINGNDNSLVCLSIYENEISGFISNEEGNLIVGKLKNNEQIVLYNDKNLKYKPNINCSTPDSPLNELELLNHQNVFSKTLTLKCVRLYFETEFDIYQGLGSNLANVVTYVTNLYNQVGTLYANDGITTTLSNVNVWITNDPYSGADTNTLLSQFQAQTSSINGDLGQLITFRGIGGGKAAGFSGICNSNVDNSLSVSGNMTSTIVNVPTYSWNVMVVTHEFGHLFGSRHTHACVWNGNSTAIDGCAGFTEVGCPIPGIPAGGGTIMSYCHTQSVGINFNNGFGPQPTAVITNNVNNGACLNSCCQTNLIVNLDVFSPNSNYKEASSTITCTNTIFSGATGIYHAGNQIAFQNGFLAQNGCDFRAYIEGCTSNFVAKQIPNNEISFNDTDVKDQTINEVVKIAPNPNNGIFKIILKDISEGTIQVSDLYGYTVYKVDFKDQNEFEMNMQDKPKGIYIVKVIYGNKTFTRKIIKE